MATAMAADPRHDVGDWANNTFFALGGSNFDLHDGMDLPTMSQPQLSSLFTSIPPNLLNDSSIERYGQVTPPSDGDYSHRKDSGYRESSIPLEELHNESSWPLEHVDSTHKPDISTRPAKRQRIVKDSAPAQPTTAEEKPRRRRGRPKAQPASDDPEDSSVNRQTHLEKNRQAAYKCRQKKKCYIQNLEERAREGSASNKALREHVAMLREEVLELKNEVLRHAGCGFWGVDEYLARCAGGLVKEQNPATAPAPSMSLYDSAEMNRFQEMLRRKTESAGLQNSIAQAHDENSLEIDELLQNMDEEISSQNSST